MVNNSAKALQDIAEYAPGMIYQFRLYPDGRSCFPFTSASIKNIYGVSPEDVLEDASDVLNSIHPDDLKGFMASIKVSAKTMQDWRHEYRVMTPAHAEQWFLGHARPQKLDDGSILWCGFITDISLRKKVETELIKTTRLYSVIAQINQMVLHSKNQQEVFQESCRIAIDEGQFRLAWIGLIDPRAQLVHPVAWSGFEDGYLTNVIKISTKDNLPEGRGPTGTALREGKTITINNIELSASYLPWHEEAKKRGFASSISLPIRFKGKIVGSFNLYSSTIDFFNTSEVQLLEKVASNISYAIDAIDTELKHREAEESLKKSEEMFSAIANLSPDIISVIDKNGELVFNSAAALRIHGYTKEDLVGKNTLSLIHPDDRDRVNSVFLDLTGRPGGYVDVQYRYLNKDGSYSWMEATGYNQLDNPLLGGIITISRDINHRKKMEEDLKLALAIRDEFLSVASHELKTPLTSLKLQLQMLSREVKPTENISPSAAKLEKSLELSTRQVNRITELVKNLLDVTRIQAGKLGIKFEEFDLSETLRDSVECFSVLMAEANCTSKIHIEKNIVGLWDKSRIEQVFDNLISNAIKYAPGSSIEISLTQIENKAIFSVKDSGPGIAPEKQHKIFERFERATSSRNISGLGLGLYITKQIVEAHHGSIQVESELSRGTIFTIELPLRPIRQDDTQR